jgi:hypothetical protein
MTAFPSAARVQDPEGHTVEVGRVEHVYGDQDDDDHFEYGPVTDGQQEQGGHGGAAMVPARRLGDEGGLTQVGFHGDDAGDRHPVGVGQSRPETDRDPDRQGDRPDDREQDQRPVGGLGKISPGTSATGWDWPSACAPAPRRWIRCGRATHGDVVSSHPSWVMPLARCQGSLSMPVWARLGV